MFTKEHMSSLRKCLFNCSFPPHVFDKGFICWSLRSKIQKNISLSQCKNTAIIKHFPPPLPSSHGGPFHMHVITEQTDIQKLLERHLAWSCCSCLLLLLPARQVEPSLSFLLSVEIYWKIFWIAKHLKILSQGSSFVYLLEKYWIEKKKNFPPSCDQNMEYWRTSGLLLSS